MVGNEVLHNAKGGIVARARSTVEVLHNTVVGNGFSGQAAEGAGGIVLGPFGGEAAHNNIVVGNRFGLNCMQCQAQYGHNDVWGNSEGYVGDASPAAGDVALDPRFANPGENDFHLLPSSPCIDAGVDVGVATDADGQPRPFGPAPDIGAFEYVQGAPGLVLNEVMANPLDERTGEFVEVHNVSDDPVDLAGFVLTDGDATDTLESFEGGPTVIPPGGFGVVLDRDYVGGYALPGEVALLTVPDARLGNSLSLGDPVELRMPNGVQVVSAFSHPFNPGNGVSAERQAPDEGASWVASPCGASPGEANCAAGGGPAPAPGDLSLVISEVMANPLDERTGEFVEVYNAGDAVAELAGLILSDGDSDDVLQSYQGGATEVPAGGYAVVLDRDFADQYEIPAEAVRLTVGNASLGNGLSINDPITLRGADDELLATYSHPFNPGDGRSAELADLQGGDVAANWAAATCAQAPLASPGGPNCAAGERVNPAALTLVINEVMANAQNEDTGEFVELFNHGAEPVEAAGLVLDDGDATDTLLIVNAEVVITAPSGEVIHRCQTNGMGRFSTTDLPAGMFKVTVSRGGYVSESFRCQIPHRGTLNGLRVDLVQVRVRVLEMYRDAALPLLPNEECWAHWTPRDLVHHLGRRAGRRHVVLEKLTRLLERVYWAREPAEESVLPQARDLASGVERSNTVRY